MKKRKTRIRWGRVCVAGIILMLVLKLLASFVMTAFEKRYECNLTEYLTKRTF